MGCGNGRHSIELAKAGFNVIGIDYNDNFIRFAEEEARKLGGNNIPKFYQGDCRDIKLDQLFDIVICLYDVIGSYIDNTENIKILKTIYNRLKNGGKAVISVMNYELTKNVAKKFFSLKTESNMLLKLPASQTMEKTGDIFNPEYFIIERDTSIVYRKEQFLKGSSIPTELIVRDKRFTKEEITCMCSEVGLRVISAQYVCAGKWDRPLSSNDEKAKEILLICEKS